MEIVAGLSLKNLEPRVWDTESPYYLPMLRAIMISYADFHQMPARLAKAKELGLRKYLRVPKHVRIYLDNGAFYFLRSGGEPERRAYRDFVISAKPDWYPIPFDAIPTPSMTAKQQRKCFLKTMNVNRAYDFDGYVPVIHICTLLEEYIQTLCANQRLASKHRVALGGIVPNLLRSPKALSYTEVLNSLLKVRRTLKDKEVHVFGIGGTATIHLAGLLDMNSADSSGWRNRAARGIVQLPGSGDRMATDLGKWRGRKPSGEEWARLERCGCPACSKEGIRGLKANGLRGFCNRATHNLYVLLNEALWVEKHVKAGTYERNYKRRLDNSIYLNLVKQLLKLTNGTDALNSMSSIESNGRKLKRDRRKQVR